MIKRLSVGLLLLLSLSLSVLGQKLKMSSQNIFKRQLISAQTGLPLSFVTVAIEGSEKTFISDIAGFFIFSSDNPNDIILFDRLSLKRKKMTKADLIKSPIIELDELSYSLSDVDVTGDRNQALRIMSRVKQRLSVNNPDQVTPYSCYVYHKMVFDIDTTRLSVDNSEEAKNAIGYSRNNHLLIIESVSERNHDVPDIISERIITGRVSGFKNPSLEYIPSQIQPFAFYNKYISLLSTDFLNPISSLGLKLYQFKISNTSITETGDTIFTISYSPRNKNTFKGLVGKFQIISGSYAILKVDGTGYADESNNSINITQSYKMVADNLWFPSLLEARIQLGNVTYQNSKNLPLVGFSKSYLTSVNLNPLFNANTFSNVMLEEDSYIGPNDTIKLADFRPVPLTQKDSTAYSIVDSLGRANHYDELTEYARSLALGFIPAGYLKIDYTNIIDYNATQGLLLGLGLYTSNKFSSVYSFGGYYRHGFRQATNSWGTSVDYKLWPKHDTKFIFSYKDDVAPTNNFNFLEGYHPGSSEAFKRFFLPLMTTYEKFSTALESRFARDFKANVYWTSQKSDPTITPFSDDTSLINNTTKRIRFNQVGTQMKWVYNEAFVKTPIRKTAIQSFNPYVWFNYAYLCGTIDGNAFDAHKFEFQIEQSIRTSGSMVTALRLTTAKMVGQVPNSLYYGAFGTYYIYGLDVPFTLGTMRPLEFMADFFAMAFIRHKIPLFTNSAHKFKPTLSLITSAATGSLKENKSASFYKGYYESGLVLDNLYKVWFIKYGAAVYYRYGPYHLPHESANWATKLVVEFDIL